MNPWIDTLGELFAAHTACVMVTVAESEWRGRAGAA